MLTSVVCNTTRCRKVCFVWRSVAPWICTPLHTHYQCFAVSCNHLLPDIQFHGRVVTSSARLRSYNHSKELRQLLHVVAGGAYGLGLERGISLYAHFPVTFVSSFYEVNKVRA